MKMFLYLTCTFAFLFLSTNGKEFKANNRFKHDAEPGSVRLVDGASENSGRVEVFVNGEWGSVCDDGWDYYAADILCKQLGLYNGWPVTSAYFGRGSGPVHIDDIECDGSEKSIFECSQKPVGMSDCGHEQDAGVICEGDASLLMTDGELRLVSLHGRKEGSRSGVLEILHAGRWGKVCSPNWGQKESEVVCRQLGYRGGSYTDNIVFPNLNPQTWLTDVSCSSGLETRLDLCEHGPWAGECQDTLHVAYVYCNAWLDDDSVQIEDVRLGGGLPYRGRAEILVAGEWGTICDDGFDDNAADVFCRMLGYFTGYALVGTNYGNTDAPIWLDGLTCTGRENDINQCSHNKWGKHYCTHSEDVGIWCTSRETSL